MDQRALDGEIHMWHLGNVRARTSCQAILKNSMIIPIIRGSSKHALNVLEWTA